MDKPPEAADCATANGKLDAVAYRARQNSRKLWVLMALTLLNLAADCPEAVQAALGWF